MFLWWFVYVIMLISVTAEEQFEYKKIEKKFMSAFPMQFKTFKGPNGFIRYNNGVMLLMCSGHKTLTESFPSQENMPINYLSILGCKLQTTPLIEDLNKLNINSDDIDSLHISDVEKAPLPAGNYTAGLKLKMLSIEAPVTENKDFLVNNPEILKPLTNLTTLLIYGTKVPPIPENIRLEVLLLQRADITLWERCEDLKELSITGFSKNIPKVWPFTCKSLKNLELASWEPNMIDEILSSGISEVSENLHKLHVQYSDITEVPFVILNVAKDLKELALSFNKLTDQSFINFPMLKNLTSLDLSNNEITGLLIFDLVKKLPALRNLTLDNNKIINLFCAYDIQIKEFTTSLPLLERLSLNKMPIDPECFAKAHFSKLVYLGLAGREKIKSFKLQKLPRTNATHLEVDLRGRSIVQMKFEKGDYEMIRDGNFSSFWGKDQNNPNFTVLVDKIDCDCENYWFSRTLREFPPLVSIPNLQCQNGIHFLQEPLEAMDCIKHDYIECVVRSSGTWGSEKRRNNVSLTVECHNLKEGKFEYPIFDDFYKLISINASDNQITSLKEVRIPDTVELIDLRGNSISRLGANDTAKLFGDGNRRVWLSRNLILCDCKNKYTLDVLHKHRNQIVDFNELSCINNDKLLQDVTSYEVCQMSLYIALGITGAFALLMLVVSIILWRKRQHIKIYLYSRGFCLICLTEEDIDSDKPYDAFISFAQGDFEYVTEKLLPKLESAPDTFRVCIHHRDWVVGDWIPAQIMRSVQLSKRTIIVLSKNFVESMWGSLEFKYAVANAVQENRKRLLVLVLDDVLSQPLDPELKSYLEFNTYLQSEDPWFWEKLRYAMPHRKHQKTHQNNQKHQQALDFHISMPQDYVVMERLK